MSSEIHGIASNMTHYWRVRLEAQHELSRLGDELKKRVSVWPIVVVVNETSWVADIEDGGEVTLVPVSTVKSKLTE